MFSDVLTVTYNNNIIRTTQLWDRLQNVGLILLTVVIRVVVKYRYLVLYLSAMLSVLDEYLIGEMYLLYSIQSTW